MSWISNVRPVTGADERRFPKRFLPRHVARQLKQTARRASESARARAPAVESPKNKEKKRLKEEKSKKRGSSEASDPLTILVGVASPPPPPLALAAPSLFRCHGSRRMRRFAMRRMRRIQNTRERHNVTPGLLILCPLPPPSSAPGRRRGRARALPTLLPTKVNKTRAFNSDPARSAAAIKRRHGSRSFTKAIQDTGAIRV